MTDRDASGSVRLCRLAQRPCAAAARYDFGLRPDIVLYLRADVEQLVRRVVRTTGFRYWESGMDLALGDDV